MRDLFEARLDARISAITTRLDAQDHALRLAQEYPTAIDKAIGNLRELHGERFASLEQRLEEQRRAEEKARDKAERSIGEQLQQVERTHESRDETTHTMLGALKERMSLVEGGRAGAASMWGVIVAVLGIMIAVLAVVVRLPW